ncbi:MAG TPA: SH3 domain-containing protein, partial [Pyrinomonadaceae bacterium]|nr:SH3 domain-containing protein [Pyrinomonadaceae bacterium]
LISVLVFSLTAVAQPRRDGRDPKSRTATVKSAEIGQPAVVVDETLSVLRVKPSLFSESIQRMRRGRKVQILGVTEADGVKFYRVTAPPANYGWVQADAVFGKFRPSDEERLASLVQAADGFEQIEIATEFFNLYSNSRFRPALSLLFGDALEEAGAKLSRDASSRLSRKEMAATAAPIHSYFLNFVSLDRYRKLNIVFLFNSATRQFHYDGTSWKDLVAKFPASLEAAEARKRLDSLRTKLGQTSAAK